MSYAKALMSTKANKNNSESSKHWCLTVAKIKTDNNRFIPLKYEDDETVKDQTVDSKQHKTPVRNHTTEPPKKNQKANEKIEQDKYFNTICEHYAQFPTPEHAYSVRDASDDNGTQLLECNESMSSADCSNSL